MKSKSGEQLMSPESLIDHFKQSAKLANQLKLFLTKQMDELKRDMSNDAFSEARIKTALLISKGIQAMEDVTKRMETAANEANQYPQNIVEFTKKLEKQIANLANAARNSKPSKKAK